MMPALAALEAFASELASFGVPERLQRPIVRLAWKGARTGASFDDGDGSEQALLAAEEAALAEIGAIVVAAGIEAEAAKAGRPSPAIGGKGTGGKGVQWRRLCWRVEACSRAACCAGAPPERCSALQRFGLALLDMYRNDLGGPLPGAKDAAPKSKATSSPTGGETSDPAARLWVLPREGAAWHGPVTAREILRLAEAGQLGFDALIFGFLENQADLQPEKQGAQPLGQSFPVLGKLARKDSEAVARQRGEN